MADNDITNDINIAGSGEKLEDSTLEEMIDELRSGDLSREEKLEILQSSVRYLDGEIEKLT